MMEALLQIGYWIGGVGAVIGAVVAFRKGLSDISSYRGRTHFDAFLLFMTTIIGGLYGFAAGMLWFAVIPIAIVYGGFYYVVKRVAYIED